LPLSRHCEIGSLPKQSQAPIQSVGWKGRTNPGHCLFTGNAAFL
jgi:hypothetical protein